MHFRELFKVNILQLNGHSQYSTHRTRIAPQFGYEINCIIRSYAAAAAVVVVDFLDLHFFPQPLVIRWKTNACRKYLEHFASNVYAIHKHICHCNSQKKSVQCASGSKKKCGEFEGKKCFHPNWVIFSLILSLSLSVVVVVDKNCNKLQCSKSAPEHKTATMGMNNLMEIKYKCVREKLSRLGHSLVWSCKAKLFRFSHNCHI